MRNLFNLFLASAVLFGWGCADKEDDSVNPIYGKENFYITTHVEMVAPDELDKKEDNINRFHLIIAFTDWGRLQMFTQTHISFEMYSDNQLKFIENSIDEKGGMWLSDLVFKKNDEWRDRLNYPWYQMVVVEASGEGEFEFAVKFYYPERNQTFITPHYRMKLWHENEKFKVKTMLLE